MSTCNILLEQRLADRQREKDKRILEKDGVFISKIPGEIAGITEAMPAAQVAIDNTRAIIPRDTNGKPQSIKTETALTYSDIARGEDIIANGIPRLQHYFAEATAPVETWKMNRIQLVCDLAGSQFLRELPALLDRHIAEISRLAKQQHTPVVHRPPQTPERGTQGNPQYDRFDPRQ